MYVEPIHFHNEIEIKRKRRKLLSTIGLLGLVVCTAIGITFRAQIGSVLSGRLPLADRVSVASVPQFGEMKVAGLSSTASEHTSTIRMQDVRAYVLDHYFAANNSPLAGTGHLFTEACDRYGAPRDCVVVAAIARAETDLCKYHTSATYYNCWGYGGGGAYRIYFSGWSESIDRVTRNLVQKYGHDSMNNPSLMERVYCGSEPGCTNWGNRVKYHMQIISDYPRTIGFNFSLFDLR